jgi:hypothetical protein
MTYAKIILELLKILPLFIKAGLEWWKIAHESAKEPEKKIRPAVVPVKAEAKKPIKNVVYVPVKHPDVIEKVKEDPKPAPVAPEYMEVTQDGPYKGDKAAFESDIEKMKRIALTGES